MCADRTQAPRIGIDGSSVVGPRTGIGYATAALLAAMGRNWPSEWPPASVLVNSSRYDLPRGDPWLSSAHLQVKQRRYPGKVLLRGWQYLKWPPIESMLGPLELVHAPASYIPPVRRARRVVTVHDLYFHYAPQHVEAYGGRYFAQTFRMGLPRVDHIIAVSNFTKNELIKVYGLDSERITMVPQGIDENRFQADPKPEDTKHMDKLGIEPPFLLCVATIEPRKNLVTLIEAYARVRQILSAARQNVPTLVITGQLGWSINALQERVAEAHLGGMVQLTGYLPGPLLPALYRQALGFVFPSLYEGFGMPVIEAMACGCPTVIARAGALPEIAGDASDYFNPRDSDNMARVLAKFITDPYHRNDLRNAGLQQAAKFSWETTARETIEVYRRVLAQGDRSA